MERSVIVTKILNSSYLKSIYFFAIEHKNFMQKDIIKNTPIKYPAHLSKSLKDLREMGIIKLENPKDTNYKRYETTQKAYELKEEIKKYS